MMGSYAAKCSNTSSMIFRPSNYGGQAQYAYAPFQTSTTQRTSGFFDLRRRSTSVMVNSSASNGSNASRHRRVQALPGVATSSVCDGHATTQNGSLGF